MSRPRHESLPTPDRSNELAVETIALSTLKAEAAAANAVAHDAVAKNLREQPRQEIPAETSRNLGYMRFLILGMMIAGCTPPTERDDGTTTIDAITPETAADKPIFPSPEAITALKLFLQKDATEPGNITIGLPRVNEVGLVSIKSSLTVDGKAVQETLDQHKSVILSGDYVSDLTLQRRVQQADFTQIDKRIDVYESPFERGSPSGTYTDHWGNEFYIKWAPTDKPDEYNQTITVRLNGPFTQSVEQNLVPLQFDLGPVFNQAQLEMGGAFYAEGMKPITTLADLPVYLQSPTEVAMTAVQDKKALIEQGVERALHAFKVEDTIERFVIDSTSQGYQGAFSKTDKSIVLPLNSYLSSDPNQLRNGTNYDRDGDITHTATHETLHAILRKLGYDTGLRMRWNYHTTSVEVLKELNEKNFFNEDGGHAQDNSREMLATALNLVLDPTWNTIVEKLSPAAKSCLKDILEDTVTLMDGDDRVPANAPIRTILPERIAQLG